MDTGQKEIIRLGRGMAVRFLVEGHESGGSAAVFEVEIPAGSGMPFAHSHDGFEETIYGLEGVPTWTVDGATIDVAPGEALCIPHGAVHSFANHSDADAKILCLITPGLLGPDFFREIRDLTGVGGPPDPQQIAEVMRRHGLTPAPPT